MDSSTTSLKPGKEVQLALDDAILQAKLARYGVLIERRVSSSGQVRIYAKLPPSHKK